ncbi:hypothetical protein ACFS07_08875 [Undibacterium arcticum]
MTRNARILLLRCVLLNFLLCLTTAVAAKDGPDCSRPMTLALHDHGLLYSADQDVGIDKDFADELIRRSGCKISLTLMPRGRIWQLIERGVLDFSLSGITNEERDKSRRLRLVFLEQVLSAGAQRCQGAQPGRIQ